MKRLLHYVKMMIVFAVVWVILEERIDGTTVLMGALIGLGTMLVTDRYVLRGDYQETYRLGFWTALRYVASLIVQIYVAGVQAVYRVLTRKLNVGIVDVKTSLTSDFHISLLANSITLTPGTVTLDRKGDTLKVIWIDCTTTDPEEAGPQIKLNFESLISGGRQ